MYRFSPHSLDKVLTGSGLIFVLILLLAASPLNSARGNDQASARFGLPRWGDNVSLPRYSLSEMPMTLRNPREESGQYLLQIAPPYSRGGRMFNQREVEIGPRAILDMRSRLISHPGETYTAELRDMTRGTLLEREQIVSSFTTETVNKRIFILNDDHEFPVSTEMQRLDRMSEKVQVARSRAVNAPEHWIDYGPSSLIIMVRPDFSVMHNAQFDAIRDFVFGGGTLFFAHPETVLEAVETPLADLLPVDPIRIRNCEKMPSLDKWFEPYRQEGQPPLHWPQGLKFVESTTRPDTHAIVERGAYPLLAWKAIGAGMVGLSAFDGTDPAFKISTRGLPLWNHVLSWSEIHSMTTGGIFARPMERAADRLTGFQAADANTIHLILAANFILIIVIMSLARLLRRQPLGWIVLGGYGILLTGAIFYAASRQMKEQPKRNLIILETVNRQPDRKVGLQSTSLFSQHDTIPVISTDSADTAFLPILPPNIGLNPMFMFQNHPESSLQIRRDGHRERLLNFNLSALRRRGVGCAFTSRAPLEKRNENGENKTAVLHYDEDGPRFSNFKLPPHVPDNTMIYHTGGSGARRLRPRNETGEWKPVSETGRLLQLNPVYNRFNEFINGSWLPANRLVMLYPAGEQDFPAPVSIENDDFARNRYTLELLPLNQKTGEGMISIPSYMIETRPVDRPAQSMVWQTEDDFIQSSGSYLFSGHLPPLLADLEVESITVKVRLRNPDGRAATKVELLPFKSNSERQGDEPEIDEERYITPTSASAHRFVFENDNLADLTDPVTGRFFLRLHVFPDVQTEQEKTRPEPTIRWQLLELTTSARGVKPEQK